MEHAWEQRNKTGTWQVPQTQEGYDTQWSVDYGLGDDVGKGRNLKLREGNSNQGCHAVIGPDDEIRGVAKGAAKNGYPDCCGREVRKAGIFGLRLDDGSVLTCYRCRLHGGESAGTFKDDEGKSSQPCKHLGCSKQSQHDGNRSIESPINEDLPAWRYCTVPHKDADAPRRQLFEKILAKLGPNDPTVQAKLTDLNAKHNKKNDNMPFDTAIAQLKNILAAGTLQALQDALDAGPSSAGGV